MNCNFKLRRVRVGRITISKDLPIGVRSLHLDRRYRVRGVADWPPEIIADYIMLNPPVVVRRDDSYDAIGNLRSVELSGYLNPQTKVHVWEHESLKLQNLQAESAALEFLTSAFGALDPNRFEESILSLWSLYRGHENFPDLISTKCALAGFLGVNRRRLSKPVIEKTQPTFRPPE